MFPPRAPFFLASRDRLVSYGSSRSTNASRKLMLIPAGPAPAPIAVRAPLFGSRKPLHGLVEAYCVVLSSAFASLSPRALVGERGERVTGSGAGEHEGLEHLIAVEQDERRRLALFLHDGPVQQLSGIALMLDGALHAIACRGGRAGAADHRGGARAAAGDDPRASQPLVRARARRPARPRVRHRRSGRSPTRPRAPTESRSSSTSSDAGELGATASVALYTIIRELVDQAVRRGPPNRIQIAVAFDEHGLVASVLDDGEPERRRTPIETIEERAHPLHGTVEVLDRSRPAPRSGSRFPHTLRDDRA